jgi:hypothetical protein
VSAVPTDEQVHEERSESGTQVGVTSPYALSLSPRIRSFSDESGSQLLL